MTIDRRTMLAARRRARRERARRAGHRPGRSRVAHGHDLAQERARRRGQRPAARRQDRRDERRPADRRAVRRGRAGAAVRGARRGPAGRRRAGPFGAVLLARQVGRAELFRLDAVRPDRERDHRAGCISAAAWASGRRRWPSSASSRSSPARAGSRRAAGSASEINSLDDLKGLKFRIAGLGGEVVRRLGATPVLTPPAEVFPAMAAGTVDAAEFIGPWNDQTFGLYPGRQVLLPAGLARDRPDRRAPGQPERLGRRCRPTSRRWSRRRRCASAMRVPRRLPLPQRRPRCSRWSREHGARAAAVPGRRRRGARPDQPRGAGRARRARPR